MKNSVKKHILKLIPLLLLWAFLSSQVSATELLQASEPPSTTNTNLQPTFLHRKPPQGTQHILVPEEQNDAPTNVTNVTNVQSFTNKQLKDFKRNATGGRGEQVSLTKNVIKAGVALIGLFGLFSWALNPSPAEKVAQEISTGTTSTKEPSKDLKEVGLLSFVMCIGGFIANKIWTESNKSWLSVNTPENQGWQAWLTSCATDLVSWVVGHEYSKGQGAITFKGKIMGALRCIALVGIVGALGYGTYKIIKHRKKIKRHINKLYESHPWLLKGSFTCIGGSMMIRLTHSNFCAPKALIMIGGAGLLGILGGLLKNWCTEKAEEKVVQILSIVDPVMLPVSTIAERMLGPSRVESIVDTGISLLAHYGSQTKEELEEEFYEGVYERAEVVEVVPIDALHEINLEDVVDWQREQIHTLQLAHGGDGNGNNNAGGDEPNHGHGEGSSETTPPLGLLKVIFKKKIKRISKEPIKGVLWLLWKKLSAILVVKVVCMYVFSSLLLGSAWWAIPSFGLLAIPSFGLFLFKKKTPPVVVELQTVPLAEVQSVATVTPTITDKPQPLQAIRKKYLKIKGQKSGIKSGQY